MHILVSFYMLAILATREFFFSKSTYVFPKRDGYGKLVVIEAPTLANIEWLVPNNCTLVAFKRRIEVDMQAIMKCTYGSHKATSAWFVPLHVLSTYISVQKFIKLQQCGFQKGTRLSIAF